MPKMESCTINVEFALALRNLNKHIAQEFRCPECEREVEPHEAGGDQGAHFEHVVKNRNCSLGHRYEPASAA